MIKNTELRIGNRLKALRVPDLGNIPLLGYKICAAHIAYSEEELNHDWAPIPITPDILEKCGFRMMPIGKYEPWGNWHLSKGQHHISYDDRTDTKGFSYNGCSLWHPTIYLHQLQNLYFSLTGEELTINL